MKTPLLQLRGNIMFISIQKNHQSPDCMFNPVSKEYKDSVLGSYKLFSRFAFYSLSPGTMTTPTQT